MKNVYILDNNSVHFGGKGERNMEDTDKLETTADRFKARGFQVGKPSARELKSGGNSGKTAKAAIPAATVVPEKPAETVKSETVKSTRATIIRPQFSSVLSRMVEQSAAAEALEERNRLFDEFRSVKLNETALWVEQIRITRNGMLTHKNPDVEAEVYFEQDLNSIDEWIVGIRTGTDQNNDGQTIQRSSAERQLRILKFAEFLIFGGKLVDEYKGVTRDVIVEPLQALRSEVVDAAVKLVKAGFYLGQTRGNHGQEAIEIFATPTKRELEKGTNPYGFYLLPKEFMTSQPARRIHQAMLDLVERTNREFRQAKTQKVTFTRSLVKAKTALTVSELLGGKPGRMLLTTTPYEVVPGGRFVPAGQVAIESDGQQISFLSASGGAESAITRAIEAGITFSVKEVDADEMKRQSTKNCIDEEQRQLISDRNKLANAAFRTLGNGLTAAEQLEEELAEAAEFESKSTLSPAAFYLDKAVGKRAYYFGAESFMFRGKKSVQELFGVIFLVERNEEGQICVADCPKRLEKLFAEFREFRNPGFQFKNLGFVGRLLQDETVAVDKAQTPAEAEARRVAREQREAAQKAEREAAKQVARTARLEASKKPAEVAQTTEAAIEAMSVAASTPQEPKTEEKDSTKSPSKAKTPRASRGKKADKQAE